MQFIKIRLIVFSVSIFLCGTILSQNVGINTTGAAPASTNLFEVLQTSTTANTVGIYSSHSGAISGTGYGIWTQKTGASTTNVAGYFTASGATNNYAMIIPSGGGSVGIGTETPSDCAILDISSLDKGLLIPRVNLTSISTYAPLTGTPVDGLMVYNTNVPSTTGGYGNGFYYWSTSASQWVKVSDVVQNSGYTVQGYSALIAAPSDGRSIYFGGMPFNYGLYVTSGLGEARIYFPKAGIVKSCYVNVYTAGTLSSNEPGTLLLEFSRSFTTTISNAVLNNANNTFYSNTNLSRAVSAGDYFEMRWDTPTWATNPTNVYISFILYVE